jgi:hypothetical protein
MWRDVFAYAINPEIFLDEANLRALLAEAGAVPASGNSPRETVPARLDEDEIRAFAARLDDRLTGTISATRDIDMRSVLRQTMLVQSAPLAATLGAWLQGLSAPGVFEDETHLEILALLADDVGVGSPEASRTDAFRNIARRVGLNQQAGSLRDFVSDRAIRDPMFRLPAIFYALSRRSDAFAPELAGIDFALRVIGLLPPWRTLADGLINEAEIGARDPEWDRLDLAKAQTDALPNGHTPLALSRLIAERHASDPLKAPRVHDGITWALRGLEDWCADLESVACAAVDPRIAMALLVQDRAREAAVYHQGYKLEGKSLATWFKEAVDDPLPLVDVLARSKLVRPTAPDKSALIGALIGASGPMFRIFRPEDVALIRRWIVSLAGEEAADHPEPTDAKRLLEVLAPRTGRIGQGDVSLGRRPADIREAYHLLQGRALPPRTRAFALDYATFWLDASRASVGASARSLPDAWRSGLVRKWLLEEHDKHADEFEEQSDGDMPSREAVIDESLQLAPLTLIDGAWLQGFTDVSLASSRIGFPLFETYWDELGNGQWSINHPKIYREVLAAMQIELAPTGSSAFARDKRLRDGSFRLPVYWLCLGKFPMTLRPEILGMNLAMELSGVGGSYRSAKCFLRHYKFPTLFVDIHNTIDNVSTGHSAWAADAIDAYMMTVSDFADPDIEWERIRTGYESLAPIVKRPGELDFFRKPQAASDPGVGGEPTYHHAPIEAITREARVA